MIDNGKEDYQNTWILINYFKNLRNIDGFHHIEHKMNGMSGLIYSEIRGELFKNGYLQINNLGTQCLTLKGLWKISLIKDTYE